MNDQELTIKQGGEIAAANKSGVESWLTPAVDIYESSEMLTLVADLPGVTKDRLHLGIEKGILTIEAVAAGGAANGALYREFGATGFSRRFQLPETLEFDQVAAELKDGVLTVTFPKAAVAKPRRIEVTVH